MCAGSVCVAARACALPATSAPCSPPNIWNYCSYICMMHACIYCTALHVGLRRPLLHLPHPPLRRLRRHLLPGNAHLIYIYIYIYIYIQRNNPLGKVHLRGIESARTHLRTHAVAHARTHARTSGLGRVRCRRRGRLRSRAPPEAGVRRASRAAAPLRSRTPSSSPGKRLRRQVELGPTPPNVAPPTAERGHRARSRVTALAPAKQAAGPPTACRVPRLTGR